MCNKITIKSLIDGGWLAGEVSKIFRKELCQVVLRVLKWRYGCTSDTVEILKQSVNINEEKSIVGQIFKTNVGQNVRMIN